MEKTFPNLANFNAMYAGVAVFIFGIDAVTFPKFGYDHFPNWIIATKLLMLIPVAVIISVLFTVLVYSRNNNARSATQVGALIVVPFEILYVTGEI